MYMRSIALNNINLNITDIFSCVKCHFYKIPSPLQANPLHIHNFFDPTNTLYYYAVVASCLWIISGLKHDRMNAFFF